MTSTLRKGGEGWGKAKMRSYWTKGVRGEVASNLNVFFVKENWIHATTRHYAESNIDILLTRNIPFDSQVRQ